jgi:protocatechuate 3,4-dioxygenase beta subunit
MTTDQDGLYRFTVLDPKTYLLSVRPPAGYALRVAEVVVVVQANRVTALDLPAEQVWTPTPTATLTPTPSATPDVFTVRGIVWRDADGDGERDAGEAGLPGATIELFRDSDSDGKIGLEDPLARVTQSGAGGAYSLPSILRGAYVLRQRNPAGYVSTTPDVAPVPHEAGRLLFVIDFGNRPAHNGTRIYLPILTRR